MFKKIALTCSVLSLAACMAKDPTASSSVVVVSSSSITTSVSRSADTSSRASLSASSVRSSQSSAVLPSSVASSSSVIVVPSSVPSSSSRPASSSTQSSVRSSSLVAISSSSAPVVGGFDVAEAKELYRVHCVECHGVTGEGTIKLPVPVKGKSYAAIMLKTDLGGNMPSGKGPLTGKEYSPQQCVGDCAHQIATYISQGFPGALSVEADPELGFSGCKEVEGAPASRAVRLLTRHEYQNSVNDIFKLKLDLTANFPPEGRDHGFTNNADIAFVSARHLDVYFAAAERVAAEATSQNNFNNAISQNGPNCNSNEHCLEQVMNTFGNRIFRRPLTSVEQTAYLAFFKKGITDFNHTDHFRQAVRQGIQALLMSPNFFYRQEMGTKEGEFYRLNDFEMATLIAYTFTGSTPDDVLLQAARNQQVRTKQQFKEQAERLLKLEKGKDQMAHFAVEWWDAGLELVGSKNPDFYKGYGPDVIQAMVGEMKAFFKHVTFDSTGKFQELYQPGYTLLNDTLSRFYGIGSGMNSNFQKVMTTQRGGILSLGAIAASNASTEESSPVKRGVFVREQLMCDPLPPLPRDVNIPNPDLDPTKPMRERFEAHSVNADCWTCHKFFDDIGYAMEIYDASGKFRTQEKMYNWETKEVIRELNIQTDGKVINIDGSDEHRFDDLAGLAKIMAEASSTKSCMTTQYYRYTMGYKLTDADQCAIKNLNKTFADSQFDIKSLLIGITQLDSFSLRK
jgi:hypothetical protein